MALSIRIPEKTTHKPIITVAGIGGAGGNVVNNMMSSHHLHGADFLVANTDAQALGNSLCNRKIQLGALTTKGLGAGAAPEVGKAAAEESLQELQEHLMNSDMLFITAGMGGGTGTGAAPVIAKLAKEMGILTVGVVTKPFQFEGVHRMRTAEAGLRELQNHLDTLIVIPNQNLFRIANERTTFADAFKMADDVLHAGVRSVTDLITMPGLINLDFADISAIMREMGKAMMGTGEASGEERAIRAAEAAISNPLLDNSSMKGAKGVLINITGGMDMTLFEVDAAANRIRDEVGEGDANIIFGSTFNPDLEGIIRVSVVATGIDSIKNNNIVQETADKPSINENDLPSDDNMSDDENENDLPSDNNMSDDENENIEKFDEYGLEPKIENSSVEVHDQKMFNNSDTHSNKSTSTRDNQSLLSRFASSIWGSNKEEQKKTQTSSHKELEPVSGDVYDVPAFLRKKK